MIWNYFNEISKIPRCSGHEEQIRNFIINLAEKNNLAYKQDEAGNLLIIKPAVQEFKHFPILILQAHLDMVCEKSSDSEHDFIIDPIKPIKQGG